MWAGPENIKAPKHRRPLYDTNRPKCKGAYYFQATLSGKLYPTLNWRGFGHFDAITPAILGSVKRFVRAVQQLVNGTVNRI